jgi:hypothetical protein
MRNSIYILGFLFASLSLFSCEKVIDIEFNASEALIVIEGELTDDPSNPQTITISKTTDFQTTNDQLFVSGAIVLITDDAGNSVFLSETTPGKYQTTTFAGVPGRTYNLTVTYDGKSYTSSCKMPVKTTLDSLSILKSLGFGGGISRSVVPHFQDPAGKGNFYRARMYINGEFIESFIYDDEFLDGNYNTQGLQSFNQEIRKYDTVSVQFMNVDEKVHFYFESLEANSSGPGGGVASPANPKSNIQGGALGYFSAHVSQFQTIISD